MKNQEIQMREHKNKNNSAKYREKVKTVKHDEQIIHCFSANHVHLFSSFSDYFCKIEKCIQMKVEKMMKN